LQEFKETRAISLAVEIVDQLIKELEKMKREEQE
jgi:hypothetical protein